eukprot:3411570-Prymnesium_polylepis.2
MRPPSSSTFRRPPIPRRSPPTARLRWWSLVTSNVPGAAGDDDWQLSSRRNFASEFPRAGRCLLFERSRDP